MKFKLVEGDDGWFYQRSMTEGILSLRVPRTRQSGTNLLRGWSYSSKAGAASEWIYCCVDVDATALQAGVYRRTALLRRMFGHLHRSHRRASEGRDDRAQVPDAVSPAVKDRDLSSPMSSIFGKSVAAWEECRFSGMEAAQGKCQRGIRCIEEKTYRQVSIY